MSWFQRIWNRLKRINSISTPFGGIGWDNFPRATEAPPTSGPMGPMPEFSAVFVPGASRPTSGRQADELLCIWTDQLRLTNISPHDAFKLQVHLEGDTGIEVQQPPAVIRSGESKELKLQCTSHFDRREIHPSHYLPPSSEPRPRDIDPLRERYPQVLMNLRMVVAFDNSGGQSFVQSFARESGKEELKSEKPRATSNDSTDELEMPPQANDPAIRDIVRQQLLQTYGRAPTKKEVDEMLAKTLVTSGVDHITEQDSREFDQMEKRRTES